VYVLFYQYRFDESGNQCHVVSLGDDRMTIDLIFYYTLFFFFFFYFSSSYYYYYSS
jgi:hypothetical protein